MGTSGLYTLRKFRLLESGYSKARAAWRLNQRSPHAQPCCLHEVDEGGYVPFGKTYCLESLDHVFMCRFAFRFFLCVLPVSPVLCE